MPPSYIVTPSLSEPKDHDGSSFPYRNYASTSIHLQMPKRHVARSSILSHDSEIHFNRYMQMP